MAVRTNNTTASSSQFHFHAVKSSVSGYRKGPQSAVAKVSYDLGLDGATDSQLERVVVVFVHLPDECPRLAHNPLLMARRCELRACESKFANGRTSQMMHFTVALPDMLDQSSKVALAEKINKNISDFFECPNYGALHNDLGNPHLHASIPLFRVIPTSKGYELGQRIDHALRPQERLARGLERSRVNELTQIRQRVAHLIADAVHHHFVMLGHHNARAHHVAERWRWGFEALEVQVQRAAARGDVDFVQENALREPTRKRRLKNRSNQTEPDVLAPDHSGRAPEQRKPTEQSIRLYTQIAVKRVLQLAQKAKIRKPKWLRRLMFDHGIVMDYVGVRDKPARGVAFGFLDGPHFAGSKLGVSIFYLRKLFGWSVNPKTTVLLESAAHTGGTQYYEQLQASGIVPKDLFSYAVLYANKWSEDLQRTAIQNTTHKIESVSSKEDVQPSAQPTKTEQSEAMMEQNNQPEYGSLYLRQTSRPKV